MTLHEAPGDKADFDLVSSAQPQKCVFPWIIQPHSILAFPDSLASFRPIYIGEAKFVVGESANWQVILISADQVRKLDA